MTITMCVRGPKVNVPCEQRRRVLEITETAGRPSPYTRRKSVRNNCIDSVTEGPIDTPGNAPTYDPTEIRLCQAKPTGDIQISPRRNAACTSSAHKRLTMTVYRRRDLRYPIGRRVPQRILRGLTRTIHLCWGARSLESLCAHTSLRVWTQRYSSFRFSSVPSRPHTGWTGSASGFGHP